MAKIAQVSMSDVAKSGRMDAGFHIASQRMKNEVEALKEGLTAEDATANAIKIAGTMDASLLREVLEPIRRGEGNRGVDDKELARLAKDYPHLALALLVEGASKAKQALDARADDIELQKRALDEVLVEVVKSSTPKSARPAPRR